MGRGDLGTVYGDGEEIVRQGDVGKCMFVIQAGRVEVVHGVAGTTRQVAVLGAGDFFGEMALFSDTERSATVRALGESRVLKVDKRTLVRRMHEDPLLALHILESLCKRIRSLNDEITGLGGTS